MKKVDEDETVGELDVQKDSVEFNGDSNGESNLITTDRDNVTSSSRKETNSHAARTSEADGSSSIEFDPSAIPQPLCNCDQWVCWDPDGGSKLPKDPNRNGRNAKTNDPETWADFETAVEKAREKGWGIGFVFTQADPFAWIDIDNCADNREALDWCPDLGLFEDTYVEWSPSGNGLHIIFYGEVPAEFDTYHEAVEQTYREILPADSGRFTTVTGKILNGTKSQINEVDIRKWVEEIEGESIKQEITQGGERADRAGRSPPDGGSNASWSKTSCNNDGFSTCYDVQTITRDRFPEGQKVAHPFHGSKTGENFEVFKGGNVWYCYRAGHECSGNYLHLLGMELGILKCGEWTKGGLPRKTTAKIYDAAREAGYEIPEPKSNENKRSIGTVAAENSRQHTELAEKHSKESRDDDGFGGDVDFSLDDYLIDEDYLAVQMIESTVSVNYDPDQPRLSAQGMLADAENDSLGSRTWSEAEIDSHELKYPDGFAHHTPAATTFYERDSENAPNWRLHHGVDDEFDEWNEAHRVDPEERDKRIYIDGVLSGLGITTQVERQVKTTVMNNHMSGFNRHYSGLVGAALGYAAYYAFDDVTSAIESELVHSSEYQQRCEAHDISPVSLIEYTFRREHRK